jgi:hypothetical protein
MMGGLAAPFNMMTAEPEKAREKAANWTQMLEDEVAKTGELKQCRKADPGGKTGPWKTHPTRMRYGTLRGRRFARRLYKIVAGERRRNMPVSVAEVDRLKNTGTSSPFKDAKFHLDRHRSKTL